MTERAPARSIAAFDSASAMVRLLAAALRGRDLPRLGQPRLAAAGVRATSALPASLRRHAYARAGALEAVPAEALGHIDLEAVAGYLAGMYPSRRYPGVLIGAANGGLTHLAAAAHVPWLPQTVLVPVRRAGGDPDRPDQALAWGERVAGPLLAANPEVELHHMHDRVQDRLMVGQMAYFRCKWTTMPLAYRRMLRESLAPGAPVVLVRGGLRWPVRQVACRHVFQNGAYGGLNPEEYQQSRFAPQPDGEAPEAEWGTTDDFLASVVDWAAAHDHPVVEIAGDDPQALADRAADVALQWRLRTGSAPPPVIVDQFIQSQPWHVLRTGAVGYWTVFGVQHCAAAAEAWLRARGPFPRVDVALFNHGVPSAGYAPAERWQRIAALGRSPGTVLGQRIERFPADFAALARVTSAFRALPDGPSGPPLPVSDLAQV